MGNSLSPRCSLVTSSSSSTTESAATSLHSLNSNAPISWTENDFTYTLVAVSIGYGDSRYQGAMIGWLNCQYGIINNTRLSIISVRMDIHNDSESTSTAPFDIMRVADENGARKLLMIYSRLQINLS
jgi:hypothetical protein